MLGSAGKIEYWCSQESIESNKCLMSQSIPTGHIRGSGFDFRKLPGGRDFVEIESETFCPCIGFISDKYGVSQKIAKNWGTLHC